LLHGIDGGRLVATSIKRSSQQGVHIAVIHREMTPAAPLLQGHLAGAMMVTAGAAANVQSCSFLSNSVVNYGDFGGAIFHDYVRDLQNTEP
jgi:hypothetical protein